MRSTAATSRCIASDYDGGPVGIETLAGGAVRAARRAGGDRRALSAAAGLHRPHAARPHHHAQGLASISGSSGPQRTASPQSRPIRRARLRTPADDERPDRDRIVSCGGCYACFLLSRTPHRLAGDISFAADNRTFRCVSATEPDRQSQVITRRRYSRACSARRHHRGLSASAAMRSARAGFGTRVTRYRLSPPRWPRA